MSIIGKNKPRLELRRRVKVWMQILKQTYLKNPCTHWPYCCSLPLNSFIASNCLHDQKLFQGQQQILSSAEVVPAHKLQVQSSLVLWITSHGLPLQLESYVEWYHYCSKCLSWHLCVIDALFSILAWRFESFTWQKRKVDGIGSIFISFKSSDSTC